MIKTAIKILGWAFSMLVVPCIGLYGIYFGFYKLVDTVDISIYDRYLTDNQFDWPIYFNEDVEEKTGIFSEIKQLEEIKELPQNSPKQTIYRCMNENIDKIVNIMNKNEKYLELLRKKQYIYRKSCKLYTKKGVHGWKNFANGCISSVFTNVCYYGLCV